MIGSPKGMEAGEAVVCSICPFLGCQFSPLTGFQVTQYPITNRRVRERCTVVSQKAVQADANTLLSDIKNSEYCMTQKNCPVQFPLYKCALSGPRVQSCLLNSVSSRAAGWQSYPFDSCPGFCLLRGVVCSFDLPFETGCYNHPWLTLPSRHQLPEASARRGQDTRNELGDSGQKNLARFFRWLT